jgi:HAD superfamily hydrolase (TIGR01509 family)
MSCRRSASDRVRSAASITGIRISGQPWWPIPYRTISPLSQEHHRANAPRWRPAAHLEEHLGYPLPPGWDEQYTPWFFDAFESSRKSVEGIESALAEISTSTCVACSGSHEKLRKTLSLTNLYPRFEGRIFSASEVAHGKPAPDLFLHAADRMGVPAHRCVVIEDSKYGVQAAHAAGMHAFGHAGGLTPREWLEDEGATVFTSMTDLPMLLRTLNPE